MKPERTQTALIVTSGFLWLLMVGLAGTGYWLAALYVLLVLLLNYSALGALRKGAVDWRLIVFPTLVWLIMWAAAFALGQYFAVAFAGRLPDFTILGFHPSFAAIIVLFWIVPTLLMGFGFELMKDRWLSRERWDDFLREVHDEAPDLGDSEGRE